MTRTQKKVFNLLLDGQSNAEIAATLGISIKTVKFHIASLLRQNNAPSRLKLVTSHYKSVLIKNAIKLTDVVRGDIIEIRKAPLKTFDDI